MGRCKKLRYFRIKGREQMKSAYATLGVPGNASAEDILRAYEQATTFYSKEKLVENPSLVERLNELKEAYKVLSSPEMRQLHDRKLSSTVSPQARTVYVSAPEQSKSGVVLKVMLVAVIAMFALGTYFYQVRVDARKAQLDQELALKKQADEANAKAAQEQAAAEAERTRINNLAESRERQLRAESAAIARQVTANQAMSQAAQARQAQIDRNALLQEERERQMLARQRVADDQRTLRNLCLQNYGRLIC